MDRDPSFAPGTSRPQCGRTDPARRMRAATAAAANAARRKLSRSRNAPHDRLGRYVASPMQQDAAPASRARSMNGVSSRGDAGNEERMREARYPAQRRSPRLKRRRGRRSRVAGARRSHVARLCGVDPHPVLFVSVRCRGGMCSGFSAMATADRARVHDDREHLQHRPLRRAARVSGLRRRSTERWFFSLALALSTNAPRPTTTLRARPPPKVLRCSNRARPSCLRRRVSSDPER
jgi:hypothetical protein